MQLEFEIPLRTLWGKPKLEISQELHYLMELGRKYEKETEKKAAETNQTQEIWEKK